MPKQFNVICHSHFNKNKVEVAKVLRDKLAEISKALGDLDGVTFVVEEFYLTKSQKSDDFDWRATCYVEKSNRKISWSDVYWAINTIHIPVYASASKEHVKSLIDAQNKEYADLKQKLGGWFEKLVQKPIDDVDNYINNKLKELAVNRTMPGYEGMLAVGKLKTMIAMPRDELRHYAAIEVDALIAA
jgi:hypothetical protein